MNIHRLKGLIMFEEQNRLWGMSIHMYRGLVGWLGLGRRLDMNIRRCRGLVRWWELNRNRDMSIHRYQGLVGLWGLYRHLCKGRNSRLVGFGCRDRSLCIYIYSICLRLIHLDICLGIHIYRCLCLAFCRRNSSGSSNRRIGWILLGARGEGLRGEIYSCFSFFLFYFLILFLNFFRGGGGRYRRGNYVI